MKPQMRKISAAIAVALVFVALHVYVLLMPADGGLLLRLSKFLGLPAMDPEHSAALFVPLISWGIFILLHMCDSGWNLGGLVGRSKNGESPDNHDFADSALTRQSIYSAIGIGAIIGLVSIEKLWGGDRGVMASCAVAALSTATLLAMVSVLCYAHSKRWKPENAPPIRRHLLGRAKLFDEISWYVLMIGLVWALAIVHPGMAVVANFGYGFVLYLYYFQFGDPESARKKAEDKRQAAEKLRKAQEQEMTDAEELRRTAEESRKKAEKERQAAAQQRHEAEKQRLAAEKKREEAERQRQASKPGEGSQA